ncbi:leukocyte elastase inhibitor-like [Polypterus senegalus]|uniref:leukocyte elastase inhibitor-like n=1 Tax=Polypterus senegalus TaxID=55291 RepID=UPI0019627049|nr:leukocyte elastase inhibitor-like [Polypterus senegalus]
MSSKLGAMEDLTAANTHFTLDLFAKINDVNPTGNLFFSPLSITAALAMVFLGSRGECAAQMAKVLHFDKTEKIHSGFQELNNEINKPQATYKLKLANRLYGEKTFNFQKEFLADCLTFYNADLVGVDFIGAAVKIMQEVNEWVENQTEGKIKDILQQGSINSMTRLILINAIYFKGNWLKKFDEKNTDVMPFRINRNESKPVKMMYQMGKFPFNYIPEMKVKVLELPYIEEELSMFVLLPDDIDDGSTGLKQLEQGLTLENLQEWTKRQNMDTRTDVHVHLPKFKLEDDYELNSILENMGMVDIFDGSRADLSGMSGGPGLFLSQVLHKSFVEVNEEGTEAAAATAGIIAFCMLQEEHFKADHPFLFFIRHNPSKNILFFGRYTSP